MKHDDLINEAEKIFLESLKAPSTEDSTLEEGVRFDKLRRGVKKHGRNLALGGALAAGAIGGATALKPEPPKAPQSTIASINQDVDDVGNTLGQVDQGMKRYKVVNHNARVLKKRDVTPNNRNLVGKGRFGNRIDPKPE